MIFQGLMTFLDFFQSHFKGKIVPKSEQLR